MLKQWHDGPANGRKMPRATRNIDTGSTLADGAPFADSAASQWRQTGTSSWDTPLSTRLWTVTLVAGCGQAGGWPVRAPATSSSDHSRSDELPAALCGRICVGCSGQRPPNDTPDGTCTPVVGPSGCHAGSGLATSIVPGDTSTSCAALPVMVALAAAQSRAACHHRPVALEHTLLFPLATTGQLPQPTHRRPSPPSAQNAGAATAPFSSPSLASAVDITIAHETAGRRPPVPGAVPTTAVPHSSATSASMLILVPRMGPGPVPGRGKPGAAPGAASTSAAVGVGARRALMSSTWLERARSITTATGASSCSNAAACHGCAQR